MKKWLKMSLLVIVAMGLTACSNDKKDQTQTNEVKVMTTFYPMYEFTKQIVGDEGNVELLIPAGTEPHDYEPSAKDIAKISEAGLFIYNSQYLETWVTRIDKNLDSEKTKVVEAAGDIHLMEMSEENHHDHDNDHHDHSHEMDPHVWLDPVLAIKEVETIEEALSEKYPDKKAVFEKNSKKYIEQLHELDELYRSELADAKTRTFVTQHAAFSYLAKQYDLTQESIAGISPDQEPSPNRLAELKHFVQDHDIKVIYFEENASSKVAETLSNETGVELAVLNPLESLTKQQLDAGETYISVMKENLSALKKSIQ